MNSRTFEKAIKQATDLKQQAEALRAQSRDLICMAKLKEMKSKEAASLLISNGLLTWKRKGVTIDVISRMAGISPAACKRRIANAECCESRISRLKPRPLLLDDSISELCISCRCYNAVWSMGCKTIRDILSKSEMEFRQMRNVGPLTVLELSTEMEACGFRWP